MAVVGVLLDRFGFRLLQDRDPLSVVLVTFGLLLVIEDFVQTVWGNDSLAMPAPAIPTIRQAASISTRVKPAFWDCFVFFMFQLSLYVSGVNTATGGLL